MFKKLILLSTILLFVFSCKKEIQSEPKFEKPVFNTSKDAFIKDVNIGDSISIFMTYKGEKGLFTNSSVNKLSIAIYYDNSKNISNELVESHFEKLTTKAKSEISNFKNYDVFQVLFYKGETQFSEKEILIN